MQYKALWQPVARGLFRLRSFTYLLNFSVCTHIHFVVTP